jgi:predicted permease
MNTVIQDLKYGLRMLAKNPGFTAVAVFTLALGIGANTALFSVVNGVLLNPLRYSEPDRLVALYSRTADFAKSSISYPNFLDWVRDNRSFSALAAYRQEDFNLTGMGEPERIPGEMISASFFPVLGVKPIIGRTFLPEEDQLGARPVAMISEGLWKRRFGSAPDALGRSLTLNGTGYTIVGVIPVGFRFAENNYQASDLYVPIGQWSEPTFRDRRASMGMDAVGRLKPGVTFAQAKSDMEALGKHLAEQYPEVDKGTGITLVPLKQDMVGDIKPFLMMLLAAVGLVLLIACVNVANLLLARSTARTQEMAIRSALGASRGRVIRQLLTESLLLALAGGGVGMLLAVWGLQGALKVLPEALPRAEEVQLDGRVLLVMVIVSALAGILFGLAPAIRSAHHNLQETLKEGGRGSSGARHRVQRIFVVAELALAVVLLAGTGLMIRSLSKLWSVDPGFDVHNVMTFFLSYPTVDNSPTAVRAHWRQVHNDINAVPSIEASSLLAGSFPMTSDSELPFWLEGQPKPTSQGEMKSALFYLVQSDYLSIMKTPLKRGRFLATTDNEHSAPVIAIDERFAQLYFPGQDPIGRRVNFDILNVTAQIVGVVGHVKQWGLDEDSTAPVQAQFYFPIEQIPDQFMSLMGKGIGVAVRTRIPPTIARSELRRAMSHTESQLVVYNTQTLEEVISGSLAARRFSMVLLGVFAMLALVLSCVGIYGVISYLASQRVHEIGIRMALGAERRDVLRMVLGEGVTMALLGVAIGLAAALGLTRLMASMLFGVSAHDPLSFAGVAGLLILVALAACYIPARRATNVDPIVALRYE